MDNGMATSTGIARKNLIGLTRAGLIEELRAFGLPENQVRMRAGQLWNAIYHRGQTDFDRMTTLSRELRAQLAQVYEVARPELVVEQKSVDGTRKWLLRLPSGAGWRLRADGARMALEESIYLGGPQPRRAEQVVLIGYQDGPQQVKWAITKVG